MKYVRTSFAWLCSSALLIAPLSMDGCSSKGNQGVTVGRAGAQPASGQTPEQAAGQPAVQQASAASFSQQPSDQAQAQPIQLPDVNLTPAGLDELLAPIALYPDPVVAVMLQAAVDPQQVMDGGNWLALDQNQNLKEAALDQASKEAGFTPVMQALLHYPTVVDMMCTQFDWTKQLGAAYAADPRAVLDSVQRLRAVAVDNGALKSSPQMKVDVTQQQGQQVVQLEPTNPKVVYVPQYDPQQVFSTTTTTTYPNGTTTTTTTTNAPATSSSDTVVVQQQQQSGVSTGTAVMIGLLSFGAGIALGAAINNNNYYYPAWGYGGVYYGGRPYYPPPYYPHYGYGWGPSYGYHRPVHYGNTNIYINNNYYNRFNNNANLRPNYKPMPVHYNNRPNGVYANSMGNRPGANKGVNYTRPANPPNRPGNAGNNNVQPRPGTPQQRPGGNAPNNNNNWKGQTTYQGRQPGTNNAQNRPNSGNVQARPGGGANTGATTRPAPGGNNQFGNRPVDRGYGQTNTGRQNVGNNAPATRPSPGNANASRPAPGATPTTRPAPGNAPASRPAATTQPAPATRPAPQQSNRQQPQHQGGGAFGGASNPSADRAATNRGRASMGAPQQHNGGNKQAPARKK
ncbi:MAG TPA: DUF3300 domain-containing protein [Candidatus Sulfotelmatobacter sp.]|nr:DUF3300 domain-containing protein [Candidatus Sulfotelmatobacter sp.]